MIPGETKGVVKAARPPRAGKAMTPQLKIDKTMEILRATVPRLDELTRGATQKALSTVTDYGWSAHRADPEGAG
jgi:hypothetical protein